VTSVLADPVDVAQLIREIERYLSTVDLFRRLGCEPRWRAGSGPAPAPACSPR
jgi:hypothetical protein